MGKYWLDLLDLSRNLLRQAPNLLPDGSLFGLSEKLPYQFWTMTDKTQTRANVQHYKM